MKTIKRGRVTLTIDKNDPDTPAMVAVEGYTSTYNCCVATGCVGDGDEIILNQNELDWLDVYASEVDAAFEEARKERA